MYPAILATGGYALLVSSLVSLIILLRKNVKLCLGSSLHMLAMSDILSSLLTGILLIFNQYSQSYNEFFRNQKINNTMAEQWMEFMNMDERAFIDSLGSVHDNENEDKYNLEETSVCNFKDVIMHYAMFLFPFVNAFISLLSFSVRSSVDIKYISKKCRRLIDSGGSCEETVGESEVKSHCSGKRNEMKVTGFGIAGQWLLPVLLTTVLQFAGHESPENMQRSNDMSCVYGTNFPFENCHAIDSAMGVGFFNETEYITSLPNDYIASIDSSRTSQADSTTENAKEVADVVSKVYQIIGSLKNFTDGDVTIPPTFYNASQLTDITKFMEMRSSTEKYYEETIDSESDTNATTLSSLIPQREIEPNEELELFENLLKNSSEAFHEKTEFIEDEQQLEKANPEVPEVSEASKDTIESTADEDIQTNKKIFADIVQKIQSVSTQLRVRDKYQPVRNIERARSQKHNDRLKLSLMSGNRLERTHVCTKRQCFMSTRFLKIHLLFLVFLVYFVPILISVFLYTRAKYACQSIKEKMGMKAAIETTARRLSKESGDKKIGDVSGPSGWFPASVSDENEISGGSLEDLVCSADMKESHGSNVQTNDKHAKIIGMLKTMNEEICEMEKLSELFKTSLLFAVLLWTPTFLEVLTKVFLCMSPVDWLMNTTFLSALLFSILRNILDLRMIRTREIMQNNYKKDNSVCPSS